MELSVYLTNKTKQNADKQTPDAGRYRMSSPLYELQSPPRQHIPKHHALLLIYRGVISCQRSRLMLTGPIPKHCHTPAT